MDLEWEASFASSPFMSSAASIRPGYAEEHELLWLEIADILVDSNLENSTVNSPKLWQSLSILDGASKEVAS
jgi:hypothetical protein